MTKYIYFFYILLVQWEGFSFSMFSIQVAQTFTNAAVFAKGANYQCSNISY